MKHLAMSVISAAALLIPAGALAGDASSGAINNRATATYSDGTSADRLYSVNVGDLDGDGRSDEAWLRVRCADGVVAAAYEVKSPRDSASGQASGKRMHKPFTITKEWGAKSGGAVGKTVSWDIKELKGAKVAGSSATYDVKKVEGTGARTATGGGITWEDDWNPAVIRAGSPNLCD
ncbi:MAG TPA: hypothetical protein VK485_01000 [Sphingomicrobium sp.]|nr:hypothetical protein [Sphingomicrobium sp.]